MFDQESAAVQRQRFVSESMQMEPEGAVEGEAYAEVIEEASVMAIFVD